MVAQNSETDKHTPGPWEVVTYTGWKINLERGDWAGEIRAENGEKIYYGAASFNAVPKLANARLIAASPDLLEACQFAADAIFHGNFTEEAMHRCFAAIAKARGEVQS